MKWTQGIDKIGLSLYFLLCVFAIANIYSVENSAGIKQLVFFGISLLIGSVIFAMRTKFFENMAGIFYVFSVLLLIGLFPFGKEVLGQKNWYRFGGFSFQPVEFAKLGIALMLSNYVAGPDFNLKYKKSLWTALAIIGIPGVIVLAIPDIGSLLVFLAFVITLYREGLSGWFFGAIFILGAVFLIGLAINPVYEVVAILLIAGLLIFFNFYKIHWNIISISSIVLTVGLLCGIAYGAPKILEKMPKHQRERIEVLFKGEKAFARTTGYNLLFSKTAIGSGGLLGKGYRQGSVTQGKFVPEQSTDYIFCTVGEEWGFLGSFALALAYTVYIGRIYYLAEKQKSIFNRAFGYCFASILFMHFAINLGMVLGLFPTVGIPLPYFSSGGTSLVCFSIMNFIFFKLNYTDKNSLV